MHAATTGSHGKGTQMEPTQRDNFNKAMIAKEERFYRCAGSKSELLAAKVQHLTGAGAQVNGCTSESPASSPAVRQLQIGELAGTRELGETGRGSVANYAGSAKASVAGSKATTTTLLMNRLQRLEAEVMLERAARQAAEAEMKTLLMASASRA